MRKTELYLKIDEELAKVRKLVEKGQMFKAGKEIETVSTLMMEIEENKVTKPLFFHYRKLLDRILD